VHEYREIQRTGVVPILIIGTKIKMKKETAQKSLICSENGADFFEKWFSGKKEKNFITHVDTLYFMVTPEIGDYKRSPHWQEFIGFLDGARKRAEEVRDNIPI
jgi:hypothetical protein